MSKVLTSASSEATVSGCHLFTAQKKKISQPVRFNVILKPERKKSAFPRELHFPENYISHLTFS
jgi:hypothetical protein